MQGFAVIFTVSSSRMMRAMPAQVLYAARVLTPSEMIQNAALVIEDGRIAAVGRREDVKIPAGAKECDAAPWTVVPGFVDVHIHGAGGHDVMEADEAALTAVASTVARAGTTSLLATTVTASTDQTCHSLEGIARYVGSPHNQCPPNAVRAEVLGIHLEGPFISPVRRGAHLEAAIAAPSI